MKKHRTNQKEAFPQFIGENCGEELLRIAEAVVLLTSAKRAKARRESLLPWSWATFASMCGVEPSNDVLLDAGMVEPYRKFLKASTTPEALRRSEEHLIAKCRLLPEPVSQSFSEMLGWWEAENDTPVIPITTELREKRHTGLRKGIISIEEYHDFYLDDLMTNGSLGEWLDKANAGMYIGDFNPTLYSTPQVTSTCGIQVITYKRTVGAIGDLGGVAVWNKKSDPASQLTIKSSGLPIASDLQMMYHAIIRLPFEHEPQNIIPHSGFRLMKRHQRHSPMHSKQRFLALAVQRASMTPMNTGAELDHATQGCLKPRIKI